MSVSRGERSRFPSRSCRRLRARLDGGSIGALQQSQLPSSSRRLLISTSPKRGYSAASRSHGAASRASTSSAQSLLSMTTSEHCLTGVLLAIGVLLWLVTRLASGRAGTDPVPPERRDSAYDLGGASGAIGGRRGAWQLQTAKQKFSEPARCRGRQSRVGCAGSACSQALPLEAGGSPRSQRLRRGDACERTPTPRTWWTHTAPLP